MVLWRCIEGFHEGTPLFGIKAYTGTFSHHRVCRMQGAFEHKLADGRMPLFCCLLQNLTCFGSNSNIKTFGF